MRSSKFWKAWEREVAGWVGSKRNPLSGANNVSDDGTERLGDVIHPSAVIEVKLRANNATISRANSIYKEVKKKAKDKKFVYVERVKGNKELVCLVLPYEDAKKAVQTVVGGVKDD